MPQPDNVTPFRPRRAPPRPAPGNPLKSHRGKAVIVHTLTLVAFAISLFTTLASLRPTLVASGIAMNVGAPPVALGLLNYLVLALVIAAVLIAASNRSEGMPWATTHHEFALRTLVIGWAVTTLVRLLGLLPGVGVATLLVIVIVTAVVLLWTFVRGSVALVFAVLRKPMPRPTGLLL
jgi:uncharacterized membrane protein